VIEFDTKIQRRYRLADLSAREVAERLGVVKGRGGTTFFPIFRHDALDWAADGSDLSGVVVFTDGFGPAPSRKPKVEVIWMLMSGSRNGSARQNWEKSVHRPAEWGTVVNAQTGEVVGKL
jgi:predicted metal-dependent peptidase